jgi:uncharacterized membrane protein
MTKNRNLNLDCLRGFAVAQMIVFHFGYDLYAFRFISINLSVGFWYWFPRVIVFCFLFSMGQSLSLVHSKEFKIKKMLSRFAQLSALAAIISVGSYLMFPKSWIYFGTLHCIAVATLIGAPLARFPKVNLVISILIIISIYAFGITFKDLSSFVAVKSMDFIPIYPWYFVVGFGIAWHQLAPKLPELPHNPITSVLALMGQHSLKIYLIHQPFLFGCIYLAYKLLRAA